ncbi:MAG: 2-dehydropantoate 2-reductase [Alphaproteobacteria bacterium]|nr:2-dehydropantoate 2-reductase [Alphaproteobacteria bacterium]
MKICIYGAGAVGGHAAALWARAGHDVTVIARGSQLDAIREKGQLSYIAKDERFTAPVRAAATPEEAGVQDVVILTVKAPSLGEVAGRLGPLLGSETPIVAALNGIPWWFFSGIGGALEGRRLSTLDPDGRLAAGIPIDRVIGCVLYIAAEVTAPAEITHSFGGRWVLGEPKGGVTPRLERLVREMTVPGLTMQGSAAIRGDICHKLIGNMSGNTVSALTYATSIEMLEHPQTSEVVMAMLREGIAVSKALGVTIPGSVEERVGIMKSLGSFKSSTLQDVERGRPIEADGLILSVQEIARMIGVPTPTIDVIGALIALRAKTLLRAPSA